MPGAPAVFPDCMASIVRDAAGSRKPAMVPRRTPSPRSSLKARKTDPGVTDVRNVGSSHWRRWLGVEHRRLPFTSFSESEVLARTPTFRVAGQDDRGGDPVDPRRGGDLPPMTGSVRRG